MLTINTIRKSKGKSHRSQIILPFTFLIFTLLAGCMPRVSLQQAQNDVKKSQLYYQRAIGVYQDLIAQGKGLERLHLELGQLYYSRGNFSLAAEEFKKSEEKEAKKLLAICQFKLANFTDAFEVFEREKLEDEEYLYYYALTCEKLNLFDKALDIYKQIKDQEFLGLAKERINIIEKQEIAVNIKDISPETENILASAPTQETYPQAGALILKCDEKIEITSQNKQISYLHYVVKILNERGKEGFSETHIDYDSTYEKVELEYARTIKPDGTVVDVGSRHTRDVSKYLNFPLYSNARIFIISFPEITEGASIEYKVKVYGNQLINKKDFVLNYPLQASEPIIAANFSIDIPQDRRLYLKNLNDKYNNFGAVLEPRIEQGEGRLIYRWEFKDIPQIMPEANMPANAEINPTILVTSFSSWQQIYDWWWSLAKDKMLPDAAIKEKIAELIGPEDSDEAKVRAIYNFCAQKIRYVAVEYGQAGYEPHKAEDIFKNKYGDCKDQAILLVTMLKEAGFFAWPVLIPTKDSYNLSPDFPAALFNHCIAAVSLADEVVFLDPTAETCALGDLPTDDQNRQVLVFREDRYDIQSTLLYAAEHNLITQNLHININPQESIHAEKSIYTHGVYDQAQRYWLIYTPPELISEALKEKIQEVSIGAKLDSYNIENLDNLNLPMVLSYVFEGPEYLTVAGPLRIMPQLASLDTGLIAKDSRKYAIDFAILDIKEAVLEIEIPQDMTINYLPQSICEDSPWIKFAVDYSVKDNKIYFRQRIELRKEVIPEEEYLDFKKFFEGLATKIKQRIILEKVEKSA